jgi:hypothetical protein
VTREGTALPDAAPDPSHKRQRQRLNPGPCL